MADAIRTITVPKREDGEVRAFVDGIMELPAPRRLANRIRIVVWRDDKVCVYADEPLDGAVLKVAGMEIPLAWNDRREPPRGEALARGLARRLLAGD